MGTPLGPDGAAPNPYGDESTAVTEVAEPAEAETQVGSPKGLRLDPKPEVRVHRPRWRPTLPPPSESTPAPGEPPPPRPGASSAASKRGPPRIQARPKPPQVVPKAEVIGSGTRAAVADIQEQNAHAKANRLHDLDLPALRMATPLLEPAVIATVLDVLRGDLDPPGSTGASSIKRGFERLVHDRSFAALPPPDQALLVATVADVGCALDHLEAARLLAGAPVLHRLNPALRERVLQSFRTMDGGLRPWLARLAGRHTQGHPALEDLDRAGTPLVQHLLRIWSGSGPEDGRRSWLGAVAHPEKLAFEGGARGWAGLLEFALASEWPSEWTRLLVGGDPVVELADGRQVEAPHRHRSMRDWMLSLPALLHPGLAPWSPAATELSIESLADAGTALFGRPYRAMRSLPSHPGAFPGFAVFRTERGDRVLMWVDTVEGELRVKAPHGRSNKPAGAHRADPERRVVEPLEGVDGVALAGLDSHLKAVVVAG